MKPARFYTASYIELKHDFWLHDEALISRWHELALQTGHQVVLFDGVEHERLYKLAELNDSEAHLVLITDYELKLPARKVYVLWPLLKPEQNKQLLQKCTELGASHFMPLLREGEPGDFDIGSTKTVIIEAAEKGEWSTIPSVREPMRLAIALEELSNKVDLYVCEQGEDEKLKLSQDHVGVLLTPHEGWTDSEKDLFKTRNLNQIKIPDTQSSENMAISAVGKLLQ